MSTSAFKQGSMFETDGRRYKLLRKVDAATWQAEESRTKRISEFQDRELRRLYAKGELAFHLDRPGVDLLEKPELRAPSYSPEQWELAKIRRAYVMAILDLPNTRTLIAPLIQETWRQLRLPNKAPHASTVLKWKRKFLEAQRDITVLIDNEDKKGNRKSRFPQEVEQIMLRALEDIHLCLERGTVKAAVDKAMALVQRENNLRPKALHLPLPTLRLAHRIRNAVPAFDRYAARFGRTAAVRKFRSVHAHRVTEAPLQRAEMDHTLLDLMVIDDKTGLPLGRPWITVCIDDFTRCVLGIYIGFEPPSYFTVAHCLKQAFMPKTLIREEFRSIESEWDAHGVMLVLVVDNGTEFHSASLENACYSLGIEIHYSARKTPWFKGKIERFLGTLNRAIAHGSPGTTFGNIFEKDEYDPSKHAVVRYSVLREVAYKWIADVYHQQIHRTLGVPPAQMWATSIAPEEILVPDDPARLDAILGRSEKRSLTHRGIELDGLLYNSYELTNLRRRLGDKLDVEIRINDADLGKIIVFSPDQREMFSVGAINSEYANDLSRWQHRVCKRYAANLLEQHDPRAWLEAKLQIAELIESEFMHKKQKTRSRIARYKGDAQLLPSSVPAAPAELPALVPDEQDVMRQSATREPVIRVPESQEPLSADTPEPKARSKSGRVTEPVPLQGSIAAAAEQVQQEVAPEVKSTPTLSHDLPKRKTFKAVYRERSAHFADSDGLEIDEVRRG